MKLQHFYCHKLQVLPGNRAIERLKQAALGFKNMGQANSGPTKAPGEKKRATREGRSYQRKASLTA
jgi:hypothetical protein